MYAPILRNSGNTDGCHTLIFFSTFRLILPKPVISLLAKLNNLQILPSHIDNIIFQVRKHAWNDNEIANKRVYS